MCDRAVRGSRPGRPRVGRQGARERSLDTTLPPDEGSRRSGPIRVRSHVGSGPTGCREDLGPRPSSCTIGSVSTRAFECKERTVEGLPEPCHEREHAGFVLSNDGGRSCPRAPAHRRQARDRDTEGELPDRPGATPGLRPESVLVDGSGGIVARRLGCCISGLSPGLCAPEEWLRWADAERSNRARAGRTAGHLAAPSSLSSLATSLRSLLGRDRLGPPVGPGLRDPPRGGRSDPGLDVLHTREVSRAYSSGISRARRPSLSRSLSPAARARISRVKRRLYERAGVPGSGSSSPRCPGSTSIAELMARMTRSWWMTKPWLGNPCDEGGLRLRLGRRPRSSPLAPRPLEHGGRSPEGTLVAVPAVRRGSIRANSPPVALRLAKMGSTGTSSPSARVAAPSAHSLRSRYHRGAAGRDSSGMVAA